VKCSLFIVAPINIGAPEVTVINATELHFNWTVPDIYTGPLTRYLLKAYNNDNLTSLPVSVSLSPHNTTGELQSRGKVQEKYLGYNSS